MKSVIIWSLSLFVLGGLAIKPAHSGEEGGLQESQDLIGPQLQELEPIWDLGEASSEPRQKSGNQQTISLNYLEEFMDQRYFIDPDPVFPRIFPDSTVLSIFEDEETGEVSAEGGFMQAFGTTFDPTESNIGNFVLSEDAAYDLESLSFPYFYNRQVDEKTEYDSTYKDTTAYSFTVNGSTEESIDYMEDTTFNIYYDEGAEEWDTLEAQGSYQIVFYDFEDQNNPFRATDTVYGWPAYYLEVDDQDEVIDTQFVDEPDQSIELDSREASVLDEVETETVNVVDTMVIQIFNYPQMVQHGVLTEGNPDDTDSFGVERVVAASPYDRDLNRAPAEQASRTIKIPLTEEHHDGNQIQVMNHQLDEPMDSEGPVIGATVAFKSDIPYSDGDTLLDARGDETQWNMNVLNFQMVQEMGFFDPNEGWLSGQIREELGFFDSYNGFQIMFDNHRYEPSIDGFANQYVPVHALLPLTAWMTPMEFEITYDIEDDATSIEDKKIGGIMEFGGAYPNPVEAGEAFTTDFTLNNTADVEVEVYNLVGKKVAKHSESQLSAGEHSIELNTEGWDKGVYLHNINVNDQQNTQRILVK